MTFTEPPVIVIDSREQIPYSFPRSVTKKLDSGDYSIQGFEKLVAVERKTKADLFNSFGRGRDRFRREIERLANYTFAALVVECSFNSLDNAPRYSQMNPNAVKSSILTLPIKYDIHVFFTGNRKGGNLLTYQILLKYLKHRVDRSLLV